MARASDRHAAAAGFSLGLALAGCCTLILWLDQGRSEFLVIAIDFLAGLPVVFARKLDIPKPLFEVLFFAYWGLNGATIARFLRRRCASR